MGCGGTDGTGIGLGAARGRLGARRIHAGGRGLRTDAGGIRAGTGVAKGRG